jgi:hypothetical protein
VPRCAAVFCFVCGVSVGITGRGGLVGILWGLPREALPAFQPLENLAVKARPDYLR